MMRHSAAQHGAACMALMSHGAWDLADHVKEGGSLLA